MSARTRPRILPILIAAFAMLATSGCGYVKLTKNPLETVLPGFNIPVPFLKGAQMVSASSVTQVTAGTYTVTSELGLHASGAILTGGTFAAATAPLVSSGSYRVYQSAQGASYAQ